MSASDPQPTLRRASTAHTNDFDDSFLGRYGFPSCSLDSREGFDRAKANLGIMRSVRSFFHRDSHVGVVGHNALRDKEDIEIHTWDGKDDKDNPYVEQVEGVYTRDRC